MAAITYGAHAPVKTVAKREAVAKRETSVKTTSLLRRFYDAVVQARLRQAEREIAMHRHLLPEDFEIAGHKVSPRNEDSLPFVR